MPDFHLTAEELEQGIVKVKSDVYPDAARPGVFLWTAKHASGWSTSGTGSSHEDCVEQINRILAELVAAENPEHRLAGGASILREFYGDQLTKVEVSRDAGYRPGRREPLHIDSAMVDLGVFETLATGVIGYTIDEGDVLRVPLVYAVTEGAGDVGRYLDSLPTDRTVVVPNVMSERLAGMLERRGFVEQDDLVDGESVPAWVRMPR